MPDGHEGIETPKDKNAKFILTLDNLIVGELKLENGIWEFQYSDPFKQQNEIKPLTDFPQTGKKYRTEELWPFFAFRVPGLNQPHVQEVIKKRSINSGNIVELLAAFGRKTITNPFELQPC